MKLGLIIAGLVALLACGTPPPERSITYVVDECESPCSYHSGIDTPPQWTQEDEWTGEEDQLPEPYWAWFKAPYTPCQCDYDGTCICATPGSDSGNH